ncbi:sugar ABC transporter substrate-binding protein [Mesorhizobium helmanticense]|uniref:ATP-grasp domain-containing protein n=1 Tax=Mesorhizobium helmanticense TaxID=1776423 RepID=A0A2T4ISA9_9HYPH|nr:sugar ABC transporter substrate-binding protein [Mesorhizobium helmanticense]PTE08458.1 hypothetical protein C9427_21000 [Mesorhizobium helmanticense]
MHIYRGSVLGIVPDMTDINHQGPIYYFCAEKHAYTIGVFLEYYENPLKGALRIIPYEQLGKLGQVTPGTFIFTDFERLSPGQLETVTALCATIANQNPDLLLLNDPATTAGRFDLLKRLKAAGINRFDVHRVAERAGITRFPVFLRWASQHVPPLSGLLATADELEGALARLPRQIRDDKDLIIVEFGAAPSGDGRYRKYSAFRVGDTIYAQHCFISSDWYVKFSNADLSDGDKAEHHDYVRQNPHAAELRSIFELAGIDYGRIDYGLVEGEIQTYEINTNPTVNSRPPRWNRDTNYALYADLHSQAMLGLLGPAAGPPVKLGDGHRTVQDVHAECLRRVRRRIRKLQLSRRVRALKQRLAWWR